MDKRPLRTRVRLPKLIRYCFFIRLPNYWAKVPRASEMFPWGSTPAKRLKSTAVHCTEYAVRTGYSQWRNKGGGDGGGPPGGKIEVILKNLKIWEGGKYFTGWGEFLGVYKRAIHGRKIERLKKKVVKKILGYDTKISSGGKFKGRQSP